MHISAFVLICLSISRLLSIVIFFTCSCRFICYCFALKSKMLPIQQYIAEELIEEERRQIILEFNVERHLMRSDNDPFRLSDRRFQDLYRLTKDMVNYLILQLSPYMVNSLYARAVEPKLRIFAALFFFATGSYQRVVGQNYHLSMAQNTISKCVKEVTDLIVQHLANEWITFPQNNVDKINIKYVFMDKTRFPGVVGAIDGTHVAILKPSEEEHNYLNRKGYHSKNVQIICDYNLKILNVNSRYAGATHDSYIWRRSAIHEVMETNYNAGDTSTWLLGDSGYPQQPWLMTPILNAAPGSPEERYNERHASARNCVERCIGVLKSRFRCILGERTLRYSPEKSGNIIISCAVLHNICTEGRLPFEDIIVGNAVPVEQQIVPNERGHEIRRQLVLQYFN